jgi:DnaJ family protein C protein 9
LSFYREQFENVVTEEAINRLSNEYKGSAEERRDIVNAYNKGKGKLDTIYQLVMLSDILEDDDRFRQILDEEIAKGTIESLPAYAKETHRTRLNAKVAEQQRRDAFDKEAQKDEAKTANGKTNGKAKPKAKKGGGGDMADLAALIQQRQKARSGGFFDQLESRYAPTSRGSKRSTPMEEPPEEMFQANRSKRAKSGPVKYVVADEDDMDLEEEDVGDSEDEEDEPLKKSKSKAKVKAKGRGRAKAKS